MLPHTDPSSDPPGAAQPHAGVASWAVVRWSLNDWLMLCYLVSLAVAWLFATPGPHKSKAGPQVLSLLGGFAIVVLLYARSNWGSARWRALAYRVGHFGGIELSYFTLAELLPAVNPGSLDQELFELDLRLFGGEPALYFDRFVTNASWEWFSFFYYSYYFLLLAHIVPILFFSRRHNQIAEFALGMTLVGTLGQLCYLLVPGYGPYHAFPELFANAAPDGFWWNRVTELVHAGGAQKDIFPSLHTALPCFVLFYALKYRAQVPYRYSWPLVAFVTLNIVISTMFLRWHYLIDVVAGLALALFARAVSGKLVHWEMQCRQQRGLGPIWPSLRS